MESFPIEFISKSEEDSTNIASDFVRVLETGDIIALIGELGSGKTFFVKKCAKALHYSGYVSSPTFTILNIYDAVIPLYHFDFYRLKDVNDIEKIGFSDLILEDGIFFIEWPEKARELLPLPYYQITFDILTDVSRKIKIEKIT